MNKNEIIIIIISEIDDVHETKWRAEAGFLVRVHPEPCLILSRAQIRALLCSSKSKFIPA
jgi:hypothetical protein